jgi:hypothetical protein
LSPFVLAKIDYHSVYPCDKDSRFKKIIYQKEVESRVTCNGILYSPGVDYYDAIPNVRDGRPVKERLNLTDYSSIYSWNNGSRSLICLLIIYWFILFDLGNAYFQECGTILGGRCHGDTLYGWGIYQAEDKEGCVKQGNPGNVGIIRRLDIIGKCASKCNLGISIHAYSPHISNRGQNYGFSAPIQTKAEPNSDNQNKMETPMKIEPKES